MPIGKENFKGKANTAGFAQNPQNINRTGANRKSFARFNEVLKAKGVAPAKKSEIVEFYSLVFNMPEEDLKKIAQDKKQPHVLRAMILELNNPKFRASAIKDMREYAFGKADETVNHTVKAKVLTPEEMKEFLKELEENY